MGVAQRIVQWLREDGHDAVHLRDEKLHRLPNGDIFVKAHAEKRIILTFDLDFGEILALSSGTLEGVTHVFRASVLDVITLNAGCIAPLKGFLGGTG